MVRCLLALNNFHSAFKPRPLNINPFRFKSFKSKMPEKSTESQTSVLQVCKLSEHALIPTKGLLTLNIDFIHSPDQLLGTGLSYVHCIFPGVPNKHGALITV